VLKVLVSKRAFLFVLFDLLSRVIIWLNGQNECQFGELFVGWILCNTFFWCFDCFIKFLF